MCIRRGIVLFVMLLVCASAYAEKRQTLRKSFLGKAPPEIVAEDNHWLGTQPPVTLAALKGKVVWLQFNF